MNPIIVLVACSLLAPALAPAQDKAPAARETTEQHDARMAWWRDARFGMFIHWGLYSIPGGEWKGKDYGKEQECAKQGIRFGVGNSQFRDWNQRCLENGGGTMSNEEYHWYAARSGCHTEIRKSADAGNQELPEAVKEARGASKGE